MIGPERQLPRVARKGRQRETPLQAMQRERDLWAERYHALAMAVVTRPWPSMPAEGGVPLDGITFSAAPAVPSVRFGEQNDTQRLGPFDPEHLPTTVLTVVEATTAPYSEARTEAVRAAKRLLAAGTTVEDVIATLREGEEIVV